MVGHKLRGFAGFAQPQHAVGVGWESRRASRLAELVVDHIIVVRCRLRTTYYIHILTVSPTRSPLCIHQYKVHLLAPHPHTSSRPCNPPSCRGQVTANPTARRWTDADLEPIGFKKNVNRATTQVMMKTGMS